MICYRILALFVLVTGSVAGLAVLEQISYAQNATDRYKVQITVTVKAPNGPPKAVMLPAATIPQGNGQTLKFEAGKDSFHFDMVVKPNQAQKLVAKTSGRLKLDGKELATPIIEQPIGTPAEIQVAGVTVKVTYTPVN